MDKRLIRYDDNLKKAVVMALQNGDGIEAIAAKYNLKPKTVYDFNRRYNPFYKKEKKSKKVIKFTKRPKLEVVPSNKSIDVDAFYRSVGKWFIEKYMR